MTGITKKEVVSNYNEAVVFYHGKTTTIFNYNVYCIASMGPRYRDQGI